MLAFGRTSASETDVHKKGAVTTFIQVHILASFEASIFFFFLGVIMNERYETWHNATAYIALT
jgi:hypothetical protein